VFLENLAPEVFLDPEVSMDSLDLLEFQAQKEILVLKVMKDLPDPLGHLE